MVKNVTGGCKSKKMANKHVNAPKTERLRLALNEGEIYAIVLKNYGNGFQVQTIKHDTLFCHIRGRFTGRNRRDNSISVGSWVLVGLRDWESTKKNCDLLEVYAPQEVEKLKQTVYENWAVLLAADPTGSTSTKEGAATAAAAGAELEFVDRDEIEHELDIPAQKESAKMEFMENGEMVDIDDI